LFTSNEFIGTRKIKQAPRPDEDTIFESASDSVDALAHAEEAEADATWFVHNGRIEADTIILHLAYERVFSTRN